MSPPLRLDAVLAAIAPYLEGRADHASVVGALWGEAAAAGGPAAVDAERLAIYARFCRLHRLEALTVFRHTRAAVEATGGEAGWEALMAGYFEAHPMQRFEINDNGAALPSWLASAPAAAALPPWLWELADLEWWSWRAETGPEGAADEAAGREAAAEPGPLRIADTVELRRYHHRLDDWLEEDPRPPAPAPGEQLVLFWRDRDLDGRRASATVEELLALKMVREGLAAEALCAATGLDPAVLAATLEDLHAAGILRGPLPPLPGPDGRSVR